MSLREVRSAVGGLKLKRLIAPALWLALLTWTARTAYSQYQHQQSSFGGEPASSSSPPSGIVATDTPEDASLLSLSSAPALQLNASAKVAVIVETRTSSGNLVPLLLHFAAVLGPSWPVLVYTDAQLVPGFGAASAALGRLRRGGRVVLRPLPDGLSFPSWDSVSDFMVGRWLWEDLAPAEHVLVFQSDSVLCANAARSVDDFLAYHLIGAPIREGLGQGYNGGLSLRSRSATLRVLDLGMTRDLPEDQWYYHRFKQLQEEDEADGVTENTIRLPTMEIARTFAVESIDYPHPVGFHQPTRFLKEHMLDINEYCPEYKLAVSGSAYFDR